MTVNSSSNAGLVPSAFSACPSELISSVSPMSQGDVDFDSLLKRDPTTAVTLSVAKHLKRC